MRPGAWLAHISRDVSHGFRTLWKSPGFTCATMLTLALGIGANTAIFSVVDTVLLRPLPYRNAERLMVVWEKPPRGERNAVSPANFLDWREQARSFEHLAAVADGAFNLSLGSGAERISGMRTSWDFFPMLGVAPALGRSFAASDDQPGAERVAILSDNLWRRKFGGDAHAIGRQVVIDGEPCTIIGVLPAGFRFFFGPELWMPLALDRGRAARDFHYLIPVGELKAGVTPAEARAEMNGIAARIAAAYPQSNQGWGAAIEPLRDAVIQQEQQGVWAKRLWILFGAVGFVLLIACVNVANLLLARGAVRQRELAVRASLGAGRARLAWQMLMESLLLAVMGGLLGLLLALWLTRIARALVPASTLAGFGRIAVDWRVLGFTLALSLATGLLFGVFPAWRTSRLNLHDVLKEGGRGQAGSSSNTRFRGTLVVVEIALSLVLLAGAALMVRSLAALGGGDPGFQKDHLLTMRLAMPENRYRGPAAVRLFYRRVLEKASAIPGVRAASISLGLPLEGAQIGMLFQIASHPELPVARRPGAPFEIVTHDYFRTMGIALRRGRTFTGRDDENSPPVAVVNETFVKRYLAGEEPLGQKLLIGSLQAGTTEVGAIVAWQIVGVVADARYSGLNNRGVPEIYVPMPQSPWPGGALALRTAGNPLAAAQPARAAVAQVDPDTPVTEVKTMEQIGGDALAQPRLEAWLAAGFAAVALAMAALGIYGLISYSVAQSTHDMGIRIALGARSSTVLALVLRRVVWLAGAGLALGWAGAFLVTRLLTTVLFVPAADPWTFTAVSLVLALVALAAGLIPARRATRIDPAIALRAE